MLPVEQHCKYVLCIPRTLHGTPLEHLGNRTTNDDDAVNVRQLVMAEFVAVVVDLYYLVR